ncbi:unnamed protein product [Lota lota]
MFLHGYLFCLVLPPPPPPHPVHRVSLRSTFYVLCVQPSSHTGETVIKSRFSTCTVIFTFVVQFVLNFISSPPPPLPPPSPLKGLRSSGLMFGLHGEDEDEEDHC